MVISMKSNAKGESLNSWNNSLNIRGYKTLTLTWRKTVNITFLLRHIILTLIARIRLRDPTRNQIQFPWTRLRMFFTATIIKATFGTENQDVGTANCDHIYTYM